MTDILTRLREQIIADAFGDMRITDYKLAERLICERNEAANLIEETIATLETARIYMVEAWADDDQTVIMVDKLLTKMKGQS